MKERRTYYCFYCKKPLDTNTDIIRFYKNAIYHLECYVKHTNDDSSILPCPKCYTTGKYWNKNKEIWTKCGLCSGKGFIINQDDEEEIKQNDVYGTI